VTSDESGDELVLRKAGSPLVAILSELIPYVGGATHATIASYHDQLIRKRRKQFIEKIALGDIRIDDAKLRQDDFIESVLALDDAITRNARREKVALFANLLYSYIELNREVAHEEFRELLAILDVLSERELCVLASLARARARWKRLNSEQENVTKIAGSDLWDEFLREVKDRCGLTDSELLAGVLAALNRTGLYVTTTGAFLDYSGDQGRLTPLYDRFAEVVLREAQHSA
jgi:hypothetical protein